MAVQRRAKHSREKAGRRREPARRPAPQKKAGRTRRPPEARRREIVLKAAEFFSRFGFDAGTRDFARYIGLSQPIIYRYFRTKQALIREVCKIVYLGVWKEHWDEILLDSRVPLRARLIEFYDQYTDVIMNSQWLRLYLLSGLRGIEITQLYIRMIEEKIIKRIVVECWKEHGLGRPEAIPDADIETAWSLQGGVFYYGVRQFVYRVPVYATKRDMIAHAVDVFIAGYGRMLEERRKIRQAVGRLASGALEPAPS
jgi:AcrR family transcriptional regulator